MCDEAFAEFKILLHFQFCEYTEESFRLSQNNKVQNHDYDNSASFYINHNFRLLNERGAGS